MLYHLIRPIARITLKAFYKKVYFINEAAIPKDKPVLLASNHPTAFIEPCILACWLKRDMHFIVRGNLFVHPIYRRMLLDLNMIPIYRKIDVEDYSDLKKNFDTLDYCYDLLGGGEMIHILAEGNTIQEKRLRPLQKGTARMAFGAIDKYGEDTDIYIVPTGVNYTQADEMRSEVMIEFGEPIRVADYLDDYKDNKNKAIRNLTKDLTTQMKPRLVTINEVEDEEVTEHLFTIYRNNFPQKIWPVTLYTVDRLNDEKQTANYVNDLADEDKTRLKEEVGYYFSQLSKLKIEDIGVKASHRYNFIYTVILIIGFIPFLLGVICNFLPVVLAKNIVKKRVKKREFKAPVLMTVIMGGFVIYSILLLITGFIIGQWQFWLFLAMIPIWGYLSILYKEFFDKWKSAKAFRALDDTQRQSLIAQRSLISGRNFWQKEGSISKTANL